MIAGHIDEVGFLVREIDKNGFIRLLPVGGWWGHVLPSRNMDIFRRLFSLAYKRKLYELLRYVLCYALFALFHYLYMNCSVKKQFHLDYVFDSKRLALLGMAVLVLGLIVISLYQLFVLRCLFILVLVILMVRNRKQIANMLAMFKK